MRLINGPILQSSIESLADKARSDGRSGRGIPKGQVNEKSSGPLGEEGLELRGGESGRGGG
jgi:hypothetical protein